jgi:predicted N-acetyltransferase YhbS
LFSSEPIDTMIYIGQERRDHAPAIEALLDTAFGQDRHRKSSYSYRRGVMRLWPLCLVALEDGKLVGTIRAWPIRIGNSDQPIVLLGPVAVDATKRSEGLGASLIRDSIAKATEAGYCAMLLVGDEPYYGRFGFRPAGLSGIVMTGENPARVLIRPLTQAAALPSGLVTSMRAAKRLGRAA